MAAAVRGQPPGHASSSPQAGLDLPHYELLFYIEGMDYRSQASKSALQRVRGMPFPWSLNPYRGCRHACLYCYARIYHSYIGFDDPADFDRVVLYKADLPRTLRRELRAARGSLGGEVAIGTATDPYQPQGADHARLSRSPARGGCGGHHHDQVSARLPRPRPPAPPGVLWRRPRPHHGHRARRRSLAAARTDDAESGGSACSRG